MPCHFLKGGAKSLRRDLHLVQQTLPQEDDRAGHRHAPAKDTRSRDFVSAHKFVSRR